MNIYYISENFQKIFQNSDIHSLKWFVISERKTIQKYTIMKKFRGIILKRIDKTVLPDPKTDEYPIVTLRVRVSNDIVPSHRMLRR